MSLWPFPVGIYDRPRLGGPPAKHYQGPYRDWQEIDHGDWHAITNTAVNEYLASGGSIPVERIPRLWKPRGECEEIRKLAALRLDSDEDKVRMAEDLLPGMTGIALQPTKYSAFLVTNRLGAYEILEQKSDRELLDPDAILLAGGKLPTLADSSCSNHIGVDVLAFVTSGRMLVTRQTRANHLSPGLLAPSGSGSVDWADLHERDDLTRMLSRAMRRELSEELGIRSAEVSELDSLRLLGYARFSHLGGKPQFFGVARLEPTRERVDSTTDRYVAEHLTVDYDPRGGVDGLLRALDAFEQKHRDEISFPLHVNILMVRSWLTANGQAASWLGS